MKFIKSIFKEFVLLMVVVIILVVTIITATATIVLWWLKRKAVQDSWRIIGDVWKRYAKHYKALVYWIFFGVLGFFQVVLEFLGDVFLKRKIERALKEPKSKIRMSSYAEDLDWELIIVLLPQLLNLGFYLAIFMNFIYVCITVPIIMQDATVEQVKEEQVVIQEFVATDADNQEKDLCPCVEEYNLSKEQMENDFSGVGLIDRTGQIKFSTKFMYAWNKKFKPFDDHRISMVIIQENQKIGFEGPNEVSFIVNPFQAFQILNDPALTFMFNKTGFLHSAKTSDLTLVEINQN